MKSNKLYKISNGIGDYWVIANHPTEAEEKVEKLLNDADYGFTDQRKTKNISIVAQEAGDTRFISGKYLLT